MTPRHPQPDAPAALAAVAEPAPTPLHGADIPAAMAALYDAYYRSSDYSRRYPLPNRATLALLWRCGAAQADDILDFGCGNGRYTLPLLAHTHARVTAVDISREAIAALQARLVGGPWAARAQLRCGDASQLGGLGPFDLVLMLFGVLSHVGERAQRVQALAQLRRLLRPQGKLVLSVPSILRRRPLEQLQATLQHALGSPAAGQPSEPGSIVFSRHIADAERRFFYHLYSVAGLRDELREAGLALREAAPESLLPEWLVTQSASVGALDAALLPWLPAALGYCFCVVAEPA